MKKGMLSFVVIACLFVLLLASCGSDSENSMVEQTVNGTLGGCQIENKVGNLRVGVMAKDEETNLLELASVAIDTEVDPPISYSIKLDMKPPLAAKMVLEGDGETSKTQLLVLAYIDVNGDGKYNIQDDGNTVGVADTKVYYFDSDYSEKGAVYGYNVLSQDSGYSQGFAGVNFFVTAAGCDDEASE